MTAVLDPPVAPAELTSFIGRSGDVAALASMLGRCRAITLCGAGGIGKTRLAIRLVAQVAAAFPDGVWFADLGEVRQPRLVAAAVAAAVGVDEEPGRALGDTLADAIRHRQALLVLDNCEHLVAACAWLCQRLLAAAPGLRIVVTSREPLRVAAETVWHVRPLSVPPLGAASPGDLVRYEAVRLLTERAATVSPGFRLGPDNAGAVARICRALDGLPLAIELAAAWLRVLSAEQVAERLSDRFSLLASANRAAPARQQTMRATIDWSHDLLSAPEQVLLRRLSVLADWSLDQAERVCADHVLPAADILDLTTSLADKSLLEVTGETLGEVRYRMLQTVREYAAGLLAAAGEAEAFRARRHEYTVAEAQAAATAGMARLAATWTERLEAFRRADAEAANLREVLHECLTGDDARTGLRLCAALLPVWVVHGMFAEGAGWIDGLLDLDSASALPDSVLGPALASRAQLALAMGAAEAATLARNGLRRCRSAGDHFHAGAALNLLAEAALQAGQPEQAAARADEALGTARTAGDRWNEAYALGTKAVLAGLRGNLRAAQEIGEQALAVMRAIEQLWGAARTLRGLGDLARVQADHETARQRYEEALAIFREMEARPDIAHCLAGLGRIAMDRGDLPAARRDLTESLRLSHATGSRIKVARSLEALGRLAVLEGRADVGLRLAGAVCALRAAANFPPLPGARTQRFLDAAQDLGRYATDRLWADGTALTPDAAVRLALGLPAADPPGTGASPPTGPVRAGRTGPAHPALTEREREVVALIAAGKSNKAIAAELFITPATAARHVANILAKLGYSSRAQVAVWAQGSARGSAAATSPGQTAR